MRYHPPSTDTTSGPRGDRGSCVEEEPSRTPLLSSQLHRIDVRIQDEDEKVEVRSDASGPMTKRPRFTSRTPSRTPPSSPDIRQIRAALSMSDAESEDGRYVSRSPSRSGSEVGEMGDVRRRFISRSPSISPDRQILAEVQDGERLAGDV